MLTDDKKCRIESLSTDEMAYEVELGHRSRFQREKFAYLKTVYKKRLSDNNAKEKTENKKGTNQPPLVRIAEGVLIGFLVLCIGFIAYHYFGIRL